MILEALYNCFDARENASAAGLPILVFLITLAIAEAQYSLTLIEKEMEITKHLPNTDVI
jgi:hypothetical protein